MGFGAPLVQTVQQLPGAFEQDRQTKLARQAFESDQAMKDEVYQGTVELLNSVGIAPDSVRLPDPKNPSIDGDTFLAEMQKSIVPLVMDENGAVSPQKLQQFQTNLQKLGVTGPESEDAFGRRNLLVDNDPLSQINLNKGGRADHGLPTDMPMSRENRLRQESASVANEVSGMGILGATGAETADPIAPTGGTTQQSLYEPMRQPSRVKIIEEDSAIDSVYDPLISETVQGIRMGRYSAEEGSKQLAKIKSEKAKALAAENKVANENAEKLKLKQVETILDAAGTHRIYKDGKLLPHVNPADVRSNPEKYSIGEKIPTRHIQQSVGGNRGTQKNPLQEAQQKAQDDLAKVNDQIGRVLNDGEPTESEPGRLQYYNSLLEQRDQLQQRAGIRKEEESGGEVTATGLSLLTSAQERARQNKRENVAELLESKDPNRLSASEKMSVAAAIRVALPKESSAKLDSIVRALSEGYTPAEILSHIAGK